MIIGRCKWRRNKINKTAKYLSRNGNHLSYGTASQNKSITLKFKHVHHLNMQHIQILCIMSSFNFYYNKINDVPKIILFTYSTNYHTAVYMTSIYHVQKYKFQIINIFLLICSYINYLIALFLMSCSQLNFWQ